MTNDELQAHIKAIEETLERGEIEEILPSEGREWNAPAGNYITLGPPAKTQYRIKPKPLDFWCAEWDDGELYLEKRYDSESEVVNAHVNDEAWGRAVHMREVTE